MHGWIAGLILLVSPIVVFGQGVNYTLPLSGPGYFVNAWAEPAPGLNHLNIFNAPGSGRVVAIHRVVLAADVWSQTAVGTRHISLSRITSPGEGCASRPIELLDSTSPSAPAGIIATSRCTTPPATQVTIQYCSLSVEAAGSRTVECYPVSGLPIVLREGTGLMLRQTSYNPDGGGAAIVPTIYFTLLK